MTIEGDRIALGVDRSRCTHFILHEWEFERKWVMQPRSTPQSKSGLQLLRIKWYLQAANEALTIGGPVLTML
eukprot:scaffold238044_cov79-Cyclotella_meneghiniana.AAC.4